MHLKFFLISRNQYASYNLWDHRFNESIYGALIIEQETTLDIVKYTWPLSSNIFQWSCMTDHNKVLKMLEPWFSNCEPRDPGTKQRMFQLSGGLRWWSNSGCLHNYQLIVVPPVLQGRLYYLPFGDSVSLQRWVIGCCDYKQVWGENECEWEWGVQSDSKVWEIM